MKSLIVLFSALALAACAHAPPPAWVPAEKGWSSPAGFEVTPPAGWMRWNRGKGDLIVTRDGPSLQRVVVTSSELGKPLGVGASKRAVVAGMSPLEAAEVVVDALGATGSRPRVLDNQPLELAGRAGFRLLAAFDLDDGLHMRALVCGILTDQRFFWLAYIAPERHYFELDLATFEELVRSFRLREPKPAAPPPAS